MPVRAELKGAARYQPRATPTLNHEGNERGGAGHSDDRTPSTRGAIPYRSSSSRRSMTSAAVRPAQIPECAVTGQQVTRLYLRMGTHCVLLDQLPLIFKIAFCFKASNEVTKGLSIAENRLLALSGEAGA